MGNSWFIFSQRIRQKLSHIKRLVPLYFSEISTLFNFVPTFRNRCGFHLRWSAQSRPTAVTRGRAQGGCRVRGASLFVVLYSSVRFSLYKPCHKSTIVLWTRVKKTLIYVFLKRVENRAFLKCTGVTREKSLRTPMDRTENKTRIFSKNTIKCIISWFNCLRKRKTWIVISLSSKHARDSPGRNRTKLRHA